MQLYPGGEDLLTGFLTEAGAEADPVLCYRYASDEEDQQVVRLVDELAAGPSI